MNKLKEAAENDLDVLKEASEKENLANQEIKQILVEVEGERDEAKGEVRKLTQAAKEYE